MLSRAECELRAVSEECRRKQQESGATGFEEKLQAGASFLMQAGTGFSGHVGHLM